ncbi:phosphotransferase [Streptomyces luteocolor]|uniref:phosphotransferase n=1 Tax=Streptomyces luteocolor TaxID=285500 RepID=UPI000853080D|nr:phosphotransferase [Streptomyces luteocolor]
MAKYTTLEQVDLPTVADSYGLDDPRLAPLAGGAANSSFRLSTASGEFVLTILDNHDTVSAESLAAHTQALFRLGVPTSAVVPATDGSLITHFDGRPVILKVWTEGRVEQPLPATLLPEAGRILAQLHALPPKSPGLTDIPIGTRRLSADHEALIPELPDNEFAAWLTERFNRIHQAEATNRRSRAVTHGDLFDDNIIVRADGSLTVLDWETISLDDPLLDLGMAAVGLAREDGELVPERVKALVSGYEQIAPLSQEDMAALPAEITHAALIIAFHRYYRHNIRFPDPSKSTYHTEMIRFVQSVEASAQELS